MNNVIDTLHHSANLVKTWGLEKLSNGKTLAETLTIDGVSLWDVLAPELAIYHVPKALSLGTRLPSIMREVRPYISLAKHKILNLLKTRRIVERCVEWPSEPVFLFLGFSGYMYRDILQPVVTRLAEHKEIRPISLYDGQLSQKTVFLSNIEECRSIWEYWNSEVKGETHSFRRILRETEEKFLTTGELSQIIKDHDQPLWQQIKPTFNWLFKIYLPTLLAYVAIAKYIIKQDRPALIISPDGADPRTRIYYIIGNQLGIPTIEIMFGDIVAMDAVGWRFFMANYLTVTGEKAREIVQTLGVPSQSIIVTGSPRYDDVCNVPSGDSNQTSLRLGISNRKAIVLFASTLSLSAYDGLVDPKILTLVKKTIFQAADRVEGIQLVVKPHPLEDVPELKRLAVGCRNISFVNSREDIRELTKECNSFLTLGSTATLGALILNKLVIWPAFTGLIWWEGEDHFLKSGAVLVVRSMEELVHSLQMVAENSQGKVLADLERARQRFLREWVFKIDGKASDRIESLLIDIANNTIGDCL